MKKRVYFRRCRIDSQCLKNFSQQFIDSCIATHVGNIPPLENSELATELLFAP